MLKCILYYERKQSAYDILILKTKTICENKYIISKTCFAAITIRLQKNYTPFIKVYFKFDNG